MTSQARQLADKSVAPPGRRNLIINGDMQVNQRGEQTGVSSSYTVDRWNFFTNSAARITADQSTDVPSGEGFSNSLHMEVTTADSSVAAGDWAAIRTMFEGQNLQHICKGTSNAKPLTLQFWIKSTVTGTYVVEFYDNDNARQISKNYTVNSANTWEKKTITIPADTTGALDNDNGNSFLVQWGLLQGSDYTSGTLETSWASSTDANRYVGQVNALGSTSNNIYLTGVQLEVGSTATEFEHRSYGEELALCQRYFEYVSDKNQNAHPCWIYSSSGASSRLFFMVQKRTRTYSTGVEGTTGTASSDHRFYSNGAYRTFTSISADDASGKALNSVRLNITGLSGVVSGDSGGYYNTGSNVITSHIYVDDEL